MQIFASSPDPILAAQFLDDKRVNKMIIESAQIICTILADDGVKNLPQVPTHQNHPIVKWAGEHDSNLWWTMRHHIALEQEWRERFNKAHAARLPVNVINAVRHAKEPKSFLNAARNTTRGLDYRWCEDVHRAYRMYLRARWLNDTRKPRWTKRCSPEWEDDLLTDDFILLSQMAKDSDGICPRCGNELRIDKKEIRCKTKRCIIWIPV